MFRQHHQRVQFVLPDIQVACHCHRFNRFWIPNPTHFKSLSGGPERNDFENNIQIVWYLWLHVSHLNLDERQDRGAGYQRRRRKKIESHYVCCSLRKVVEIISYHRLQRSVRANGRHVASRWYCYLERRSHYRNFSRLETHRAWGTKVHLRTKTVQKSKGFWLAWHRQCKHLEEARSRLCWVVVTSQRAHRFSHRRWAQERQTAQTNSTQPKLVFSALPHNLSASLNKRLWVS